MQKYFGIESMFYYNLAESVATFLPPKGMSADFPLMAGFALAITVE
ncbi:hypothetical protein [Methylomonas koyamae]|nr:hypothetical protein [Methylomonas koyamae]